MILKSVIKNDLCTGCGFCEFLGNKMVYNSQGFIRPQSSNFETKEQQKVFKKVCPGTNTYFSDNNSDCSIKFDKIWGKYIDVFKGYSTNKELRFGASSGGAITSIIEYCISNKIADEVIVTRGDRSSPLKNESFLTQKISDIYASKSSRYSPSSPLKLLRKAKDSGKKIILIGKPCDITGFKNLTKVQPEWKEIIILTISFLCAGVPSEKGTEKLIENFNLVNDDVVDIKYRGDGCPGHFKITTKNNETKMCSYNESWGSVLNKYLQKRCKLCPDGVGEAADIVCGDIWEEKNGRPVFENNEGFSLIITRNKLGSDIINGAIATNLFVSKQRISFEHLNKIQQYQYLRRKYILARVLGVLFSFKPTPRYDIPRILKFWFLSPKYFLYTLYKTLKKSLNHQL